MTPYSATITLLLVMDPLGNIPLFLSALKPVDPAKRQKTVIRESLIALFILGCFLFFGKYILDAMRISENALSISGGIILFLIAIRMIFPHEERMIKMANHGDPFIVPLAIPLVAGPSTMAMVMLLASQEPEKISLWALALFIAWLISTLVLMGANRLSRVLGSRGLLAIEKLMGMILTTMAVQMFMTGVAGFFPS
jgi:multiple antibiotic resistance protein